MNMLTTNETLNPKPPTRKLKNSHGNGRPDSGMRVVSEQFEVLVVELMDILHPRIKSQCRKGARRARELQFGLFEVIRIQVQIAECVDEGAGPQSADLSHHHGEQSVRGDVKRHAQEQIRAALVKLTA